MGKYKRISVKAVCAAATLLATSAAMASPLCDETTVGDGCIEVTGGKGVFTLNASFDIDTGEYSGSLQYADTGAGFQVSSATVLDYSYVDGNLRGFIFAASGPNYNEVRVYVADNGEMGDQFQIQLLQNGNIIYDAYGQLSATCADSGIEVECGATPPPPPPCPEPKPDKPGKDKPDKPGKNKPKGNNGVGNGEDPQPPGNPPINDGPGTGPGNPGNRGGAKK